MADRPINLYQHEVKAVRAGRQTQLRRVLKPQPHIDDMGNPCIGDNCYGQTMRGEPCLWNPAFAKHVKLAAPGDRLWVRETWKPHSTYAGMKPRDIPPTNVFYRADDRYAPSNTPWIAAPQMPRWASRITLLVDEVRVQRLQSISEEDCWAEGLERIGRDGSDFHETYPRTPRNVATYTGADGSNSNFICPRLAFSHLWRSINGPGSWEANPWVEVRTFRTVLANIDEVTK